MKHKEKIYKKTSIFSALVKMWINTFNYTGTASRSEYWIPVIFQILIGFISFGLVFISFCISDMAFLPRGISIILSIYLFLSIVPWISLTVRRLRDSGKSAWWIVLVFVVGIGIIILAILCAASSIVSFNPAINQSDILYAPPTDIN